MDYRIEKKDKFELIGTMREFSTDTSSAEIPAFWDEHFSCGDGEFICGMFGLCYDYDSSTQTFKYMIADSTEKEAALPDKFIKIKIEAKTWLVFPVKGALPTALQDVNTKIWNEWLPNCREYELDGNLSIEMYSSGDTKSANYYSEIWIPIKK